MRPTFFDAYVETALWSSMDNADDSGGEPLDRNYDIRDIAPETLQRMREDCENFQRDHAELLAQVPNTGREWSVDEQNGHDFWLTRNGHGAGFWDRGYGALGYHLTNAAHVYGSFDLYIGDDGQIYGA
jgi:hypothetical protein